MRILLIKTSSLGDIIHTLPALTDALAALPQLKVDWVIEERFVELARHHPAVDRVIPVAIRRWRKKLFSKQPWSELITAVKQMRAASYDLIIDAQGLAKTVWLSWCVTGATHGYALGCARDKIIPIFYSNKHKISLQLHAIDRIRRLFSASLAYVLPKSLPDYSLAIDQWLQPALQQQKYIILLHNTTWKNKHWPEQYWISLAKLLQQQDYTVRLAWGSVAERQASERIAGQVPGVKLLPDLNLFGLLPYLANAKAVVSVDTGLGHLAAALAVPTIALYGPTDAKRAGVKGSKQLSLAASFGCAPCLRRQCQFNGKSQVWPACFAGITPELVLQRLLPLLAST